MNNLVNLLYIFSVLLGVYVMSVLITKYLMKYLLKNRRIFKLSIAKFFFIKHFVLFLMFSRFSILIMGGFITVVIIIYIFFSAGSFLLVKNLVLLDGSSLMPFEYIESTVFNTPMQGPVAPVPAPIPPTPPIPPANPPLPLQVPQGAGNPFFTIPLTIFGPAWFMSIVQNGSDTAAALLFISLLVFTIVEEYLTYKNSKIDGNMEILEAEVISFLDSYKGWDESEENLCAALIKLHKDYLTHITFISKTPGGGSDADRRTTELFKLALRKGYQIGRAKYKWFRDNFTFIFILLLGMTFLYVYILPGYPDVLNYLLI